MRKIHLFSLSLIYSTLSYAQISSTGCWATLYDQPSFAGEQINLYNGIDLPTLQFADEGNWRGKIKSLITGPNARLTLYGEKAWLDREFIVEPDTKIQSFDKLPWNYIESLRMICVP